jgi:hypothetical protein
MRISLRAFLITTALVALFVGFGVRYWVNYVERKSHYMVDGYIKIVDWDIERIEDEGELRRRFLIDPDSSNFYVNTEINGVVISPSLHGAHFKTQGTYWNYEEKVRDVREQMDDFAQRNSDWTFERAGIRVMVLERSRTHHVNPPIPYKQEFEVFPVPSESAP